MAMTTFESAKSELLSIVREFSSLFGVVKSIPGIARFPFEEWEKAIHLAEEQINENTLRVAVVGAIKSGKSTFVNAILGGDYLKRGAGVVTSIVTRVRKGPALKADLVFKTWEEVNSEIDQALVLFPSVDINADSGGFDIRREDDREELAQALNSLSADQIILQDSRDMNVVLISSYLRGYDRVKDIVSKGEKSQQYSDTEFVRHKDFVGDDTMAVYLKDVALSIPASRNLDENIEIADCQGSDSPNPLHLAMIQDYLLKTHLIIYLLSSRTGMRQADIRFLSMIKKMGLMENILFVINCDFNEHENLENLQTLVARTAEELSVIKPLPEIFTFSTLFDLLRRLKDNLSERDSMRVAQWEKETELKEFSEQERTKFETTLHDKLSRDRFNLLLKNHLARCAVMAGGIRDWVKINSDILSKDAGGAKALLGRINYEYDQMNQVRSMIRDTVEGASQKTKRELEKDINRFLDSHYGDVIKDIQTFVRGYTFDTTNCEDDLEGMGFSSTLYKVFQDFRLALDRFMTETVNPRLVHFIREDENKLADLFQTVAVPFDTMVKDTFKRYEETLSDLGIQLSGSIEHGGGMDFDIDMIKRKGGFTIPPLASSLQYTARLRAEAFVRLGYYNVIKVVKKWLKRPIRNEREGELSALRDGVKRIKRETERSLVFHMTDYRENLKFQYMFKLVDVAAGNLHDTLLDRFQIFSTDLSEMIELIDKENEVKDTTIGALRAMDESLGKVTHDIDRLRAQINF